MIFILHYILFNSGLPAILIILTLFLQTYSKASLTEIGTLLMVLPFLSIIIKPLFCALADRQQAHKHYLAGSLAFMILGYGSLIFAPFFPDFLDQHSRLIWYLDVIGIVIGFSAFGVAWSLGDALAVNAARRRGIPWGSYRVWATFSWGLFGWLIGQINETPLLPKYVPGLLMLVGGLLIEIVLLILWPKRDFDMTLEASEQQQAADMNESFADSSPRGLPSEEELQQHQQQQKKKTDLDLELNEMVWPSNRSLSGTLGSGSARVNPRLMSAVANLVMEDIGSSLKSSLKLGQPQKRAALADLLEHHQLNSEQAAANINEALQQQQQQQTPILSQQRQQSFVTKASLSQDSFGAQHSPSLMNRSGVSQHTGSQAASSRTATLGKATLRRTQLVLARMNSLSSASGHAIADELQEFGAGAEFGNAGYNNNNNSTPFPHQQQPHHQQMMIMSSLASNASLSRAAAARAMGFGATPSLKESPLAGQQKTSFEASNFGGNEAQEQQPVVAFKDPTVTTTSAQEKSVEDLQLVLLKLIIKRDSSISKYLIIFTLFGVLLFVHISYFFLHVEQLCRQKGYDFSSVMGALLVAQSLSEIFSFLIVVPYLVPKIGRIGSILSCALIFALRYAFYGTYYSQLSPYSAIATETCHGVAYAMTYSLITDIATESVNQVDHYLPELIKRRLVSPQINPNQLKLPLRATMQGVFSGAFDGLGNGIGALFAGIYLDSSHSCSELWLVCTYLSLAIALLYPLTEWSSLKKMRDNQRQQQKIVEK